MNLVYSFTLILMFTNSSQVQKSLV